MPTHKLPMTEGGNLSLSTMSRKRPAKYSTRHYYWRALVWGEGTREDVSARVFPEGRWLTESEAVRRGADFAALAPAVRPEPAVAPRLTTVRELLEAFLGELEPQVDSGTPGAIRDTTFQNYVFQAKLLVTHMGQRPLASLRPYMLDDFARTCGSQSHTRIRHTIGLLLRAGAWATERELAVVPRLSIPRWLQGSRRVRPKHTPSDHECEQIVSWVAANVTPAWVEHFLWIQWRVGFRVSELATLRRDEVLLEDRCIALSGGPGRKTGSRSIPLGEATAPPDELARRLALLPGAAGNCIFDVSSKTATLAVNAALREACDAVGVAPFTSHGLRRTAENRLLNLAIQHGMNPEVAAGIMGNASGGWRVYQDLTQGGLDALIQGQEGVIPMASARRRKVQ